MGLCPRSLAGSFAAHTTRGASRRKTWSYRQRYNGFSAPAPCTTGRARWTTAKSKTSSSICSVEGGEQDVAALPPAWIAFPNTKVDAALHCRLCFSEKPSAPSGPPQPRDSSPVLPMEKRGRASDGEYGEPLTIPTKRDANSQRSLARCPRTQDGLGLPCKFTATRQPEY